MEMERKVSMSFNVYVTRRIPDAGLEIVEKHCGKYDMNPEDRVLVRDELLEGVRGRDGVLCLLTDTIDADVFEAAGPQCKVFANYAVGSNNIDVEEATRRGIVVTNTPGVLTDATADLAWALLFSMARRIVESDKFMRTGKWTGWGPMQFLGADITGRTLGIVGAGRIGSAMAKKSRGFEMKVLYYDTVPNAELEKALGARRVELDELLAESDFVSVHVPLLPETTHLIDAAALKKMKKTAILINSSRGPVVEEKALREALKNGTIAGAGLDVYEKEPIAEPGLEKLDNVVMIPHLGSATKATRSKMAELAANNLVAALKGETPPNCINPEALKA